MITVIVLALARKSVAQLLALGALLKLKLVGNVEFSDADISLKLAELEGKGTALEAQQGELDALRSGVTVKEIEVHTTAAEYKEIISQLANLCEGKTKDAMKLAGGGFTIRGQPEPVGDMPKPSVVKATRGDMDGEIDVTTPSIHGARIYICEVSSSASGPFVRKYEGTKSTFTITGAQPGELCHLRLAALDPNGTGPWSNVVACRAA
jgi:hypothetical protein